MEVTTNSYYDQQVGRQPNGYIPGQATYPPRPKPSRKPVKKFTKRKGARKKMAKRKSGFKMKGGSLNPLGIAFFTAAIYFSSAVVGVLQSSWVSFNLPSLGGYSALVFTLFAGVLFYWIAKQLIGMKLLRF